MYNIKKAITELTKNDDFILKIPEYDIYKTYLGNIKIGTVIKSPFRNDNNPSFGLYYSKGNNKLMYHDFATNERGSITDFIMTIESCSFTKALNKIKSILGKNYIYNKPNFEYIKGNSKIGIVRQRFTNKDIEYWSNYNISINTLKKFKVFSIKYFLLNDIVKWIYSNNSIMFAYKIYNHFKIYRPFEKTINKWRSNCNASDIQGLEQLPVKGDLLVITKSLKDVMVLYELGYNSIAPHSETTKISREFIINLKKQYKNIVIFYDNDEPGINNSNILYNSVKDLENIYNINIDLKYKVKDISDFIKKYKIDKTKEFLNEKFKKYNL